LPEAAFADKFVMYYMQQAQPKHMRARDKLFNGAVRMAHGGRLQPYVMQFRAVIMDAEPILATDAMFYFKQGLHHELRAECLTDAMGQPFASLDALITHAFVQEQKLICRHSAPRHGNAQLSYMHGNLSDGELHAELSYMQGPYQEGSPAKRGRFDRGGHSGSGRWGDNNGGGSGRGYGGRDVGRGGFNGGGRWAGSGGRGTGRGGRGRERTSGRSAQQGCCAGVKHCSLRTGRLLKSFNIVQCEYFLSALCGSEGPVACSSVVAGVASNRTGILC
jgi:uncharacterized membrane protein YgcG